MKFFTKLIIFAVLLVFILILILQYLYPPEQQVISNYINQKQNDCRACLIGSRIFDDPRICSQDLLGKNSMVFSCWNKINSVAVSCRQNCTMEARQ